MKNKHNNIEDTTANPSEGDATQISGVAEEITPPKRKPKRKRKVNLSSKMTVIATDSNVPFQGVPLPYNIDNLEQEKEIQLAMQIEYPVVLVPVTEPGKRISKNTLSRYGVKLNVIRIIDLPDGKKNAFLMGGDRVEVKIDEQDGETIFIADVTPDPDSLLFTEYGRFEMTMNLVKETYEYIKSYISEIANIQMAPPKEMLDDDKVFLNFMIVTAPVDYMERVRMLAEGDLCKRAEMALVAFDHVKQQIDLRKEIFSKTSAEVEREQREMFLRNQIRQIQREIGDEESDIDELENKASQMNWPEGMKNTFRKEIGKLRRFNPNSPDYAIQYTYLETLLGLPWNNERKDNIDIKKLEKDLDRDHYGLEKIKERIVEHVAVLKLRGDMKSPIICLYGPPGVGKTSLCKSIADSIGREYARISLGGLHDETQIRGHRRTYIGALPGRIISALGKLESNNPVFVLDEIDKIGDDHRGDPAQALLEVLDPEQNSKFYDNYLDVDYDLSKTFFIATANSLSTISRPLLDRMELIEITGYLPEEKIEIAKRHLIPKLLESHGYGKNEIKFSDEAIRVMIESYTRESGVRKLEKTIAQVLRKIAVLKSKDQKYPKKIGKKQILSLLGKEDIVPEIYEGNLPVGVIAGLAWTPVGGEILYFESSLSKGKGNITLTGNLGDVMKESATIAMQWVKANAEALGIDPARFQETDVHLHVPEGAVPKDGPSAGVTMVCSIVSSFTGRKCRDGIAMTGEATLSGKVLPVGGVKEKILAAKRAGITDIILSAKNERDIKDIEERYLEGLRFHYVDTLKECVDAAIGL